MNYRISHQEREVSSVVH